MIILWFFFFLVVQCAVATPPVITVPNLLPETLAKVQVFSELHNAPFLVHVVPATYSKSLLEYMFTPAIKLHESFNGYAFVKNVFSFAMSFGPLSYLLCAYILYRGYAFLRKSSEKHSFFKNDHEYLMYLLQKHKKKVIKKDLILLKK